MVADSSRGRESARSLGCGLALAAVRDVAATRNWRGPIWFPINYLLIETLRVYHRYLGDAFRVEFLTGSGRQLHADTGAGLGASHQTGWTRLVADVIIRRGRV